MQSYLLAFAYQLICNTKKKKSFQPVDLAQLLWLCLQTLRSAGHAYGQFLKY